MSPINGEVDPSDAQGVGPFKWFTWLVQDAYLNDRETFVGYCLMLVLIGAVLAYLLRRWAANSAAKINPRT